MKRLVTLLLVLALCLGMTACNSEPTDREKFEAANALLEEGDYEGALEAFTDIEAYKLYNEIAEKVLEIDRHFQLEKLGFLEGVWMDLSGNVVVTCDDEGNYTYEYPQASNGEVYEGEAWMSDEDILYLMDSFTVEEIDGVTHLVSSNYDLVPEADYAALGVQTIEITAENMETYFELREAVDYQKNEFGEIISFNLGYGIFLKEEYVDKVPNQYNSINVSFKYVMNRYAHDCEFDPQTLEISIGGRKPYWSGDEGMEETISVQFHHPDYTAEESTFYNQYAAEITGYAYEDSDDEGYVCYVIEALAITDVTGTIQLRP